MARLPDRADRREPILAVSLLGPLLLALEALGIPSALMVFAITGGWALSGVTSPFTASVLLVSAYGKAAPTHVGLEWNGLYTLGCETFLSMIVIMLAGTAL